MAVPGLSDAPATARRRDWELTMNTFGVDADVDSMSRRRRGAQQPAKEASRTEVGRRAYNYGDIVDLMGKKKFHADRPSAGIAIAPLVDPQAKVILEPRPAPCRPVRAKRAVPPPSGARARQGSGPGPTVAPTARPGGAAGKDASGILPQSSLQYDDRGTQRRHNFFDGQFRAQRYAELLGRPDTGPNEAADPTVGTIQLAEGAELPLALRRVLASTLPSGRHPDFQDEAADMLRTQVEHRVMHRYAPPPRKARSGQRPARQPAAAAGQLGGSSGAAPSSIGNVSISLSEDAQSTDLSLCAPYSPEGAGLTAEDTFSTAASAEAAHRSGKRGAAAGPPGGADEDGLPTLLRVAAPGHGRAGDRSKD